jgi:hypothetical protein
MVEMVEVVEVVAVVKAKHCFMLMIQALCLKYIYIYTMSLFFLGVVYVILASIYIYIVFSPN